MGYHRTTESSRNIEKRLNTLKLQLYGKESPTYNLPLTINTPKFSANNGVTTLYIKSDLLRVGLLALITFGLQLIFYFTLKTAGKL